MTDRERLIELINTAVDLDPCDLQIIADHLIANGVTMLGHSPEILYICDRRRCKDCSPSCCHTSDISHAANFELFGPIPREKEAIKRNE